MQVECVESMPFGENSYILHLPGRSEALVIDPGFEPEPILQYLARHQLSLAAILNTHGHVDHIAGNAAMARAFPEAPIIIGSGDAPMLTDPWKNLSGPYGMEITSPPANRLVEEGDVLDLAGIHLEVLWIPGHSPGHVAFVRREGSPMVFGGDVLFAGSIGRTDFPGGSLTQLLQGIRTKLWPLPDEATVYPGHGPTTTIGHEKATNPFLNGEA